jgi:hypothetical protein
VIIIFGSNATLDAGQKGRFFNSDIGTDGSEGKTSLELHDITLKNGNGKAEEVSKRLKYFFSIF